MYFCFSDKTSAGHAYQTPNTYFTFYRWYFILVTADYNQGIYNSYIYDGPTKTLRWTSAKSV